MPALFSLAICAFTAEIFYDGKLQAAAGLERQSLGGTMHFDGSGLWYLPVTHAGNQNVSHEEIDAIERVVTLLTAKGAKWTPVTGRARSLTLEDILVVAPYNAQVAAIATRFCTASIASMWPPHGRAAHASSWRAPGCSSPSARRRGRCGRRMRGAGIGSWRRRAHEFCSTGPGKVRCPKNAVVFQHSVPRRAQEISIEHHCTKRYEDLHHCLRSAHHHVA